MGYALFEYMGVSVDMPEYKALSEDDIQILQKAATEADPNERIENQFRAFFADKRLHGYGVAFTVGSDKSPVPSRTQGIFYSGAQNAYIRSAGVCGKLNRPFIPIVCIAVEIE